MAVVVLAAAVARRARRRAQAKLIPGAGHGCDSCCALAAVHAAASDCGCGLASDCAVCPSPGCTRRRFRVREWATHSASLLFVCATQTCLLRRDGSYLSSRAQRAGDLERRRGERERDRERPISFFHSSGFSCCGVFCFSSRAATSAASARFLSKCSTHDAGHAET
jgi:hypothetical protein